MEIDDFDGKSRVFIDCLQQNGTAISPKIGLVDLRQRSAGRGVVAVQDIAEDEELFSIPRSACVLTAENSSLSSDIVQQVEDPWFSLILAMTYEYRLGQASKWHPYFEVLPAEFDTLMYWTDQELAFLQGSAVVDKIGKQTANQTFAEKITPIVRQHEATFKAEHLTDDDLLALLHRMGSTIMAYAFDLESSTQPSKSEEDGWEEDSDAGTISPKGMIPLADMVNADADRNNAKLYYEEDKVVMKAIKAVKMGEELFNDYGPLPRADVLRRYGYVTNNYAQYDVVEIPLKLIKEGLTKEVTTENVTLLPSELESRLEYLEQQGFMDDSYDIALVSNEDGQMPEEFTTLINALTLGADDFAKLKKKEKLPKPELTREGAQLAHCVFLDRRNQYPARTGDVGSYPHDEVVMDTRTANTRTGRRYQMAMSVVNGELAVLQEAIDTTRKLMAGSDSKRKVEDSPTDSPKGGKRQKT